MPIDLDTALQKLKGNDIEYLNLHGKDINDRGCEKLCKVLERNTSLTHLRLSSNVIGYAGCQAIGHMLARNKTLEFLVLYGNSFEDRGAEHIARGLKQNNTLRTLILQIVASLPLSTTVAWNSLTQRFLLWHGMTT